ncbi:hypothetical protein [Variovorax sp. 278MFTsu5.1]|uniref:hypothetical protein n=1 Tax=Variovorax sp. 278MFTsu5.1 TaxID=3158366 RepID=UPI003AAAC8AF
MIAAFLSAADAWVCDGYWVDIRYVAERASAGVVVWQASISFSPVPPKVDSNFRISTARLIAGQLQRAISKKKQALDLLRAAVDGRIEVHDQKLALHVIDSSSDMSLRDRWYSILQLSLISDRSNTPLTTDLAEIDNALRTQVLPFDGLADLCGWLGLLAPGSGSAPQIHLQVGPPCDLVLGQTTLAQNKFQLTFHAHPKFDISRMDAAIRAAPGRGLDARKQITEKIRWRRPRDGLRIGVAEVDVSEADNALAMLMIGGAIVRRHWFIDPAKARNGRLLTMQHFDKDLRMIRAAVFEATESARFERGVAALLFLLGFTAAIPLETDSPDIVVTTPGGRVVLVECTIRIADFASKVGKLVDRRGSVVRALTESGHPNPVLAALVCRVPRGQIAIQDQVLGHGLLLITNEDLVTAFERVRTPSDPDTLLQDAMARVPEGVNAR